MIGITIPITKWSYQISKAAEIPTVIAQAFHIAQSGRPGPVLISLTRNAQVEMMDYSYDKEAALKMLEHEMNDVSLQADPAKSQEIAEAYAAKEQEIQAKYEKWEQLTEA